jgi:tRNA1(Val) A37 N6-methylase TrmN6
MPAETASPKFTVKTTDDAFLGGRLKILQPADGYRAGIDAVFLAAAINATSGERVLEAGSGVGVAALCLAARVEGVHVLGLEVDPDSRAIACENAARNGVAEQVRFIEADITLGSAAAGLDRESFDHVMANPPYYETGRARTSDNPRKSRAHVVDADALDGWVRLMVSVLKPRGTLTLIHRADALDRLLATLVRRVGGCRIRPLHPRPGEPASRIIVQGVKGSRAPLELLPGFILHGPGDGFTEPAEKILRHGAALAQE